MPWLHVKYNYFEIISAFVHVPSEIVLAKSILEAYCSSWIFSNTFSVAEI